MINIDTVIKNIKEIRGLKFNKQVAEMLELSPADFSIRKKRGTLLLIIIQWALDNKISIDWLLTGKKSLDTFDTVIPLKKEPDSLNNLENTGKTAEIITKLTEIEKISKETYNKVLDYIDLVHETAATVSKDIFKSEDLKTKKRRV